MQLKTLDFCVFLKKKWKEVNKNPFCNPNEKNMDKNEMQCKI